MPDEPGSPKDARPAGPSAKRRCPICGKPAAERFRPFCSKRCADHDLHRWFGEVYRIPTNEEPDDGVPSADGPGGDRAEE